MWEAECPRVAWGSPGTAAPGVVSLDVTTDRAKSKPWFLIRRLLPQLRMTWVWGAREIIEGAHKDHGVQPRRRIGQGGTSPRPRCSAGSDPQETTGMVKPKTRRLRTQNRPLGAGDSRWDGTGATEPPWNCRSPSATSDTFSGAVGRAALPFTHNPRM